MLNINIFTDGACSGNPGPGGWGAIIICGQESWELFGGCPIATNNQMELAGPIEALKKIDEPSNITITTDSQYVVKGMTKWKDNWIKNNWRNSQKKEVANKELWIELIKLSAKHKIKWSWVKGHNGHPENERCDVLAQMGIKKNFIKTVF